MIMLISSEWFTNKYLVIGTSIPNPSKMAMNVSNVVAYSADDIEDCKQFIINTSTSNDQYKIVELSRIFNVYINRDIGIALKLA